MAASSSSSLLRSMWTRPEESRQRSVKATMSSTTSLNDESFRISSLSQNSFTHDSINTVTVRSSSRGRPANDSYLFHLEFQSLEVSFRILVGVQLMMALG